MITFRTAAFAVAVTVAVAGCSASRPAAAPTPSPATPAIAPLIPVAPTATSSLPQSIRLAAPTLDCATALAGVTTAEALDIAETVFRHQLEQEGLGQEQRAPAFFLSLFGEDPTPAFLARFNDSRSPVNGGSGFEQGAGRRLLVIDCIQRVTATTAEVSGGVYVGNLGAAHYTYTVERLDGRWVVTDEGLNWKS